MTSRVAFKHNERTVYEWEQSLDEIRVFIPGPPDAKLRAKDIDCVITTSHVRLGIKGNPPYLNEDLFSVVVESSSFWLLNDGKSGQEIELTLTKMRKGETWDSVFKGHALLNPMEKMEAQKKMTLERFQEEHPGFDFSGADMSGAPPDPREFMGGVKYG